MHMTGDIKEKAQVGVLAEAPAAQTRQCHELQALPLQDHQAQYACSAMQMKGLTGLSLPAGAPLHHALSL